MDAKVEITNDLGVHLRAAGVLVKVASRFKCEVWLEHEGTRANAKSIMSVLTLGAAKGSELNVSTDGDDESLALEAVVGIIQEGFYEK